MTLDLGVVTGSLSPAAGGLFQCMRVPTNLVAQRGARVSVYGLLDDQFEQAKSAWSVSKLSVFPTTGIQRFGYAPAMMRVVLRTNHDLLHLHGIWFYPSRVVQQWRRRMSRPTVISPVGMLDQWSLGKSWAKKRLIRLLYEDDNLRMASAIHANSTAEAVVIRKFGLTNPIAVMPNGIDLPDLATPAPPGRAGLHHGKRSLLFLGRIHAKKGLKELIHAWARVRSLQPALYEDWSIAIAGWDDGGHRGEIEKLVRESGLCEQVSFLGPVYGDKKAALLRHAHAFVLPSFGEGMPIAVLEAWASALPVLMTAACNLADSFKANAAYEISMEPETLARQLVEFLGDEVALARMGQAGRLYAERHHDWPRVIDDMMAVYGWLVGGGQRPSCVLA